MSVEGTITVGGAGSTVEIKKKKIGGIKAQVGIREYQCCLENYLIEQAFDFLQVKILVPNSTAGMVIGKGGNYIKQIKEESGAYIQISQKSKETNLPERCITVAGTLNGGISSIQELAAWNFVNSLRVVMVTRFDK